jgi:hypothetical protein
MEMGRMAKMTNVTREILAVPERRYLDFSPKRDEEWPHLRRDAARERGLASA